MRVIKFRVYDLASQQIRYDITGLEYCGNEMTGIFVDGDFYGRKETELMQYTGLKDKNGVEIYDGDIVSIKDDERKAIVGWSDTMFGYILNYIGWCDYDCLCDTMELEVIGNIYDNPELLKECV